MWSYESVKQTFLDYFASKEHVIVPSSSVIPKNDPSLLFVNSGMVQFKPILLGDEPIYKKVCNSQKCIRAGGKHNDLDDVGKDSYHHTFFEMLGNWYFNADQNYKYNTINMAWDLLVNVYKLDKDCLYVTYFEGNNDNNNIEADIETKQLWLQFLPEHRILPFGMKDNFWEMGHSGPCGPCTEIHYDTIGNRDASALVNKDDSTVIEIWNLVFMQFVRHENGSLSELTKKHVDCGAGLERITAVLNHCTNYEIDVFKIIINIIQEVTDGPFYTNKYGLNDSNYIDTAYRVIADHIRTMIVAINDGVIPGSSGKNYVVRRLIRRAVRYGTKLGAKDGFLSNIVGKVIEIQYKEITNNIVSIIHLEEVKFNKVMKKGLHLFYKIIKEPIIEEPIIHKLFSLYTTYGFPIDIIKQLCEESNIIFDNNTYEQLLYEHKLISK